MSDLRDPRLIYLKGVLFLCGCLLASVLLLLEHPEWRTAALLALAIWCAARFYYFLFCVIEHYVDSQYRFTGIWSFVCYLATKRSSRSDSNTGARTDPESPGLSQDASEV